MKKIIVLGAGMVGSAIARDLSKKYVVTSVDRDEKTLKGLPPEINKVQLDINDRIKLKSILQDCDIVVSAVPGFIGTATMLNIIEEGKDLVDISFMPEDVLQFNQVAVDNNVTVIMDCGVAPGMANIVAGYHNSKMEVTQLEYMVGGLPKVRKFPFEYKAPFSPCDVIEEYTRPARYVENGEVVVKPAMSDLELLEFENVGTLEAFNTDGLRSLIKTMPSIPNMKEKTLRYPGHIEKIKVLKASGFLSDNEIEFSGNKIKPIDFTSQILFDDWKLGPDEKEFTIMRIELTGILDNVEKKIVYNLYDEFNKKDMTSSMARTTGYTAAAAVELILNGGFNEKGIFPPELVGKYETCYNHFINYLSERDIVYKINES